jgi:hypothetical protein
MDKKHSGEGGRQKRRKEKCVRGVAGDAMSNSGRNDAMGSEARQTTGRENARCNSRRTGR